MIQANIQDLVVNLKNLVESVMSLRIRKQSETKKNYTEKNFLRPTNYQSSKCYMSENFLNYWILNSGKNAKIKKRERERERENESKRGREREREREILKHSMLIFS